MAPIRSMARRWPADKVPSANHKSRIAIQHCERPAAPGQRQQPHGHDQQSDKPDHDDTHPGRRAPQRNGIGIVRPNALHEDLSPEVPALGRSGGSTSSKALDRLSGRAPALARNLENPGLVLADQPGITTVIVQGWEEEKADQLLRRPSAVRFHCETLSAIIRVDFMAAWLSWA
jgi:hypothetical protein